MENILARAVCLSLFVAAPALAQKALHYAKPLGLAVDQQNNLYIASVEKRLIYKRSASGAVSIVAGTGKFGRIQDGIQATKANLAGPWKVAFDLEGSMYIADAGSVRIYKVDTTGILTTLVGTGEAGYSGDGGPAKAAALSAPISLAVGPDGSIFIAADAHDRIRKIGSDGIIQTMAGTGEHVFGGDGGPAIAASLKGPSDIAIDRRGNLFVADTFNHRIREIDTRGLIRTVAGNGTTEGNADIDGRGANKVSLNAPESIAVDDDGNLFIADSGNGRICRVDREGIITTVAGRGNRSKGYNDESSQAISAVVNNPFAVAADHEGNIYIADYGPGFPEATKTRVRKIDRSGIIRTVFSDTGTAGE